MGLGRGTLVTRSVLDATIATVSCSVHPVSGSPMLTGDSPPSRDTPMGFVSDFRPPS